MEQRYRTHPINIYPMSSLLLLLFLLGLFQMVQILLFLPVHFLLDLILLTLLPIQLFLLLPVSLFLLLLVPQISNLGLCGVIKSLLLGIHLSLDLHNVIFQLRT